MSPYDNIVDAVHGLSLEEKLKLRLMLDEELKCSARRESAVEQGSNRAKRILGLFADEPELMERVMESVYEQRGRPLRVKEAK